MRPLRNHITVAMLVVVSSCWTFRLRAEGPSIEVAPKKLITSVDSRHPEIVRATNGDLVLVFSGAEGVGHDNALQHLMSMFSTDDGATWSETIDIYPLDGNNEELRKDPYVIVAPNGDLVCSYTNPHQENTGSYSISSDNGRTWTSKGLISQGLDPPVRRFTGGDVVGNTIYASGESFHWDTMSGLPATFWKSTDNAQTWEIVDELKDPTINEWDVLALTQSHFIAVARTYPTDGKTLFFESNDAGQNWSVPVDISVMTGIVQDPNLDWLNKAAGTIILHGRRQSWDGFDARSAFWLSRDSGATWTDYTPVTSQNTADEYSGFAEYNGQSRGYLVWGENARLYGSMVREIVPPLVGDLDDDGFVGGADLDIVRANWESTIPGFTYENSWNASAMPEASTLAFEFTGDAGYATLVTTGDDAPFLNIDTPATFGDKNAPGSYSHYTLNNDPAIDMTAGGTIDFTMRVNGQSDPADDNDGVNAIVVYVPKESGGTYLYVLWAEVDKMAGHDMDTSQWHDYRLLLESPGEDAMLFVDDEYATSITGTPVGSLNYNGIRFGDVSDNRSGDADWKFIGWTSDVLSTEAPTGDINGDGIVDEGDLEILKANWGTGVSPTSTNSVPEPSVYAQFSAAIGTLLLFRLCGGSNGEIRDKRFKRSRRINFLIGDCHEM